MGRAFGHGWDGDRIDKSINLCRFALTKEMLKLRGLRYMLLGRQR